MMTAERRRDLERMVTKDRARQVAANLFPGDFVNDPTFNCHKEHGREGQLCRICEERNQQWKDRIAQVREAMVQAFR